MIAVEDIAYVRYAVPDLAAAEAFMTDYGLSLSARTASAIYMRGTGHVGSFAVGGFSRLISKNSMRS